MLTNVKQFFTISLSAIAWRESARHRASAENALKSWGGILAALKRLTNFARFFKSSRICHHRHLQK